MKELKQNGIINEANKKNNNKIDCKKENKEYDKRINKDEYGETIDEKLANAVFQNDNFYQNEPNMITALENFDYKPEREDYNRNHTKESNKRNVNNIEDTRIVDDEKHLKVKEDYFERVKKFAGVFKSLREKKKKKGIWRRSSFGEYDLEKKTMEKEPELTRSEYSLVSNGDVTDGALQLWLTLPEEVKYDPALAAFRQFYEKETARQKESLPLRQRKTSAPTPKIKRLPAVSSAPHLNNNERHMVSEDPQNGGVYFSSQDCKVPVEAKNKDNNHEESRIRGIVEFLSQDYKIPMKTVENKKNNHDLLHGQKKPTTWDKAKNITKLTLMVGCWVFFTVIFFMFNEKETIFRNCVLQPGATKDYILDIPQNHLTLRVDLSGPFLSELGEKELNRTEQESRATVEMWVERWILSGVSDNDSRIVKRENFTVPVSFMLLDSNELVFSEAKPRWARFEHQSSFESNTSAVYVIRMLTDAPVAVPMSLSYQVDPISTTTGVIYACLLLVLLYALIIFEIINRTLAAIVVSTLSLAVLSLAGERPSVAEVISWLDVETLLLLLSMMLLVAIMAETGMFDFIAVFTFQVTKGKMWPLINLLCIITAVLSTFLDNVTTVLLITPVTIKLCEVMDMYPIPVLIAMVLFSNIGGTATPVGDPPNVIIASNQVVIQSGINFANFTLHMTIGIIAVCLQTYLQLRFMYRDVNKLRPSEPREIQDLRRQLNVWRRAADSLPHMSKDELVVKERLERKVQKINTQLSVALKERKKRACPKDTFQRTLSELKEKYKIRDKKLLIKSCVAIGFVVTMFFLHAFPEFSRVSLGWTALLGAILLLILADREDIESILHRVEWSTLLFFAALFVLMEALTKLGFIDYIGGRTEALIMTVDETHRLAVALLLILWISGVTSAFVDNIPLTTMMVRVVTSLGTNPSLGLPLPPLIWALSYGACLGGNGTLIGASANVVCAGVAEQHGYKITFMQFFKVGFPIMIGHLIVASGYLILCHCLLTWH